MKKLMQFFIMCCCLTSCIWVSANSGYKVNILKYGAKKDGQSINTKAINRAIEDCYNRGGGTVVIPSGVFLTGTIHLKSNVSVSLQKGAVVKGSTNLDDYYPYIPVNDRNKDANAAQHRWNRALILGTEVENVTISGEGIIDGDHVFDEQGEEKMRGPHTVVLGGCRNLNISGITFKKAANYAIMAYNIENAVFNNLVFNEGWDGIHIRGGKNMIIRGCEFYTGDDAIAGGNWENMVITDCQLNSSCNGIRLIMPATDLTIAKCTFKGPGKYPHRTSKERQRKNMLTAVLLQPGGWGKAPGKMGKIHIHDIDIENVNTPFLFILNEGNEGNDIVVERIKAKQINLSASSIESWKEGRFGNVLLKDIWIEYTGNNDPQKKNITLSPPHFDSRELPCWGFFARNVDQIKFENVHLTYTGEEVRPAFYLENVSNTDFSNTACKGAKKTDNIIRVHSGEIKGNLEEE